MSRFVLMLVLSVLATRILGAAEPAGLVVIVHPESGIERLSREEVIDIFLGRFRKLPSGRVALPIDVETRAERSRFYELLVDKSLAEINSYWARLIFSGQTSPPFEVADAKAAIALVQRNPNAIAYVDRQAVGPHVRVVLEIGP